MRPPRKSAFSVAALCLLGVVVCVASCAQEEYPAWLWYAQHPGPPPAAEGGAPEAGMVQQTGLRACPQTNAQPLAARLVAMSAHATATADVVLVSDLFQRFVDVCGSCHGPQVDPPGQGQFQIQTANDFPAAMTAKVLAHVTSDIACPFTPDPNNPQDPMPPCGNPNASPYSQRADSDPVKQLVELVQAWMAAGEPKSFVPMLSSASGADGGSTMSLAMSPAAGNALTNIGNCVPTAALVSIEDQKSKQLDAMFAGLTAQPSGTAAQMIGLPEHLGDTDLFTLDSQVLAPYGVVAYAPGYPLWSDGSGKLRHVRVPRGTSIHFNKQTQQFEIPPNTRFYKTFLKQVIDTDNSIRWRKIETRLIVSRPDTTNPDGTAQQNALFGTYKWTDDESDAVLIETPLNSGRPFADTLFAYHTDEPLAADILAGQPADPEEALLEGHAARHYAIPSSQRCIQCHMGSPAQAFVLGFTPLQINRKPENVSGVIEPAGPDELTQLQRFIDYGIITGVDSPSDLLPLEKSQGTRLPRNNQELLAQSYMLGNCAHCHNPRGFPSVTNPVLVDVLNFLPGPNGGIFQFPLDRFSPRIGRGLSGSTPIPYITPSLMDLPRTSTVGAPAGDVFATADSASQTVQRIAFAPWRSLIYRNTDAAFTYTDDYALFPHMPFNTGGYDPRAKQFLADWMVSIPAVRKHPDIPEYAFYAGSLAHADLIGVASPDTEPQPYVEVPPGDPRYDAAAVQAQQRLSILHTGSNPAVSPANNFVPYSRYGDPGDNSDILDPQVLADPLCHPIPTGNQSTGYPFAEHPHWVVTDLSQLSTTWAPRRADWPSVLVEDKVPPPSGGCQSSQDQIAAHADEIDAVGLLQSAKLDEVRAFATTAVPFGLWQQKPGCKFSKTPTVQSFTGSQRPNWMDVASPTPDAPVYMQTPGAAVFKMICINCHGPKADSHGRLSDNLATMTGGLAVVADFRDGLFGPVTTPGANRSAVYSVLPADASQDWKDLPIDDRAARYMAWMGLGGTEVVIPQAILQLVAVSQVLGHPRVVSAAQLSANMLAEAKVLCAGMLGPTTPKGNFIPGSGRGYLFHGKTTHLNDSLIYDNADADTWLHICSQANPHPVHILNVDPISLVGVSDPQLNVLSPFNHGLLDIDNQDPGGRIPQSEYPGNTPVGNDRGGTDATLLSANAWPWCVDLSHATSDMLDWATKNNAPACPPAALGAAQACQTQQAGAKCFGTAEANRWAVRGAINAGFSVFLYVQAMETAGGPDPDYNQCELLQ